MSETEKLAQILYEGYCLAVGGKAFNGDDLPKWEAFRADQSKLVQSNGWMTVAELAKVSLE